MESENKAQRNNQQISLVLGDFELCLYSISKVCFVCLKNPVIQEPGIGSSIASGAEQKRRSVRSFIPGSRNHSPPETAAPFD